MTAESIYRSYAHYLVTPLVLVVTSYWIESARDRSETTCLMNRITLFVA